MTLTTEQEVLDKFPTVSTRMLTNLTDMLYSPHINLTLEEVRDCFSKGQLASKLWLIDELSKLDLDLEQTSSVVASDLNVLIVGGWIGSLANLMFNHYDGYIRRIVSIDIDPRCQLAADYLNIENMDGWRFKAFTADMYEIDYVNTLFYDEHYEMYHHFNTVINTSCEHIPVLETWLGMIPHGKLVILQSNNFFNHPQHVNCSESLEDFEAKCSLLNSVHFKGVLRTPNYDRYMIIGYR